MFEDEATNKATERRFVEEIWNKGNFALAKELVTPEYLDHDAMTSGVGPDGVRQEVSVFRNAFPDLRFAIDDMVAEGDKVVTRLTASGTHEGDLPGIPATGKRVTISGIVISRYKSGKAAEAWFKFDFLGLYRQLGAIPARRGAPDDHTR